MFTRLFEIPQHQLENFPQEDALCYKQNGEWKKVGSKEFVDTANQASLAFLSFGLNRQDKIAIISNNRPEWNFIDVGILQAGLINVPIYPNISEDDYKFIFNDAEIKIAFVSDKDLFQKIKNIQPFVSSLKEIYSFEKIEGVKHWTEFLSLGKKEDWKTIEQIKSEIKETDLATIIYTSGTTGTPKGVMHSHKSIISNIKGALPLLPVNENHRALSFLPLNHIFERLITYLFMSAGVSIYYAESMDKIGDNLKEIHPHIFTAVPRLLEKVYDKIVAKGTELKGIKKALFFWALNLGLKYELQKQNGWWYEFQLAIANKIIFKKWREALGGNIVCLVTGGAALQPRLARVFTAGKIPVMEGYGLTEAPATNVNRYNEDERRFGSVGPMIGNTIEEKIAEDGEILIKGDYVMLGYYKRKDLTDEAIDKEGYFHTGDIGQFAEGKYLKITDRKKEIFKTSGGKYIAPQAIENIFKQTPFIEQIIVIGENQKFASTLIVPAFPHLESWCKHKNIKWTTKAEMVQNPSVIDKFKREILTINKTLGNVEQLKKFELVADEWSPQTGELTPTMKLKRKIILQKYKNLIEKIYSEK